MWFKLTIKLRERNHSALILLIDFYIVASIIITGIGFIQCGYVIWFCLYSSYLFYCYMHRWKPVFCLSSLLFLFHYEESKTCNRTMTPSLVQRIWFCFHSRLGTTLIIFLLSRSLHLKPSLQNCLIRMPFILQAVAESCNIQIDSIYTLSL